MNPQFDLAEPAILDALRDALVRSEARYGALVDRAGYGVYRSSEEGQLVDANSALATMLGYRDPSDLLGLNLIRDIYADPDTGAPHRQTSASFADWVDARWKRRDGSPITVRLSMRPIIGPAGQIEFVDGLVEDVTDRQRHDELLRRNERMATLGTTLAGVAHELNNPLAAIIGFSQLLLKKSWTADDRAALEAINHEAIRSATIVRDLLSLTRGREGARRAPVNLNQIIVYIVRTRRYALETTGIGCVLDLDSALPMVTGDPTQLEQVLLNLMNNAEQALRPCVDADHGPSAAHIAIRTRCENQEVILEVEDNGPGIPHESRAHIWDPFWTTKDEGSGTGLGLTVVHGIIADHGGTISLESAPGFGARFVVRLPAIPDPRISDASRAIRPLDVLIVDPGASDLVFVERFLTSRGHAVINAANGELAVRLAGQTTFDAVVCAAGLFDHDGLPIASILRSTPGCARARFVLSSRGLPGATQPHGVTDGSAFIAHPYDVEELRRLIEGD